MTGLVDKAREAYERWGEIALEQDPAACTDYINALEAENASLREQVEKAREDALEEAAAYLARVPSFGDGAWAARHVRALKDKEERG